MKSFRILILPMVFAAILFSCSEEENDTQAPVINLSAPVDMQMYNNGDTVYIQGTVTENDDLHEMVVSVKRSADSYILFQYIPTVHGLESYQLDTFWVVSSVSAMTMAEVEVIASDHHENIDTATVNIHLMP